MVKIDALDQIPKKSLLFMDTEEIKADENWTLDQITDIKNALTDVVNWEFINTPKQLNLLLETTFKLMNYSIDRYVKKHDLKETDISFFMKGGSLMRSIYLAFGQRLFGSVGELISEYYSDGFNKSDNDWSLLVNPFIKNYHGHFKALNDIVYFTLSEIRDFIIARRKLFFEFYAKSDIVQKEILDKARDEIRKKGYPAENIVTSKKYDTYIEQVGPNIQQSRLNDRENEISISYNTALKFSKGGEDKHFNLIRSKVNFYIEFRDESKSRHFMGELQDVSIPREDDDAMKKFKNDAEFTDFVKNNIQTMTTPYKYKVMNIHYLLTDLTRVLFIEPPYTNKKYEKRLRRLFYLMLIERLMSLDSFTPANIDKVAAELNSFSAPSLKPIGAEIVKTLNSKGDSAKIADFKQKVIKYKGYNKEILESLKGKLKSFGISQESVL